MMIDEDRRYYRRRIEQEQLAADSASCAIVRDTHLELIDLYTTQLTLRDSASLWQAPAPNAGRRSFSALFASTIERPGQAAAKAPADESFLLQQRPH